ncbi:hypothetical protein CDAR_605301 [Caerostris darwini]|uniref:Uncharacterized protein n=1 Tax=Caerostris darwini TaxID=1538125 RepID=A0AAV4N765_9ARAC|nr:hypothetical protein CDAR_605301 [Caerostris darwini]
MSNPSMSQLKKKRIRYFTKQSTDTMADEEEPPPTSTRYFKKQSTDTMADEEEPPPGIPEIWIEDVDEPEDVKAEDVKNINEPEDQTKDVKPVDEPFEKDKPEPESQ